MAISSPIGIEALAPDVAAELIAAHLDGVLALGERFLAWGPVPCAAPEPAAVDEVLARGCVGVSLPAAALADRTALEAIAAGARARAVTRRPAVRPSRRLRRARVVSWTTRCGGRP